MINKEYIRLRFLIKELKENGKLEEAIKLIKKYNITIPNEAYYD